SDTDGRAMLGRFQTTSQTNYDDVDVRATVESIVEFEPKLDSFSSYLMDMKTAQSRVYLLYARYEDAHVIFRDAAIHNMTDYGHIWIVTEQALSANNTPIGIIGLKLNNAENETDHIKDAIYILASAIKEMTVNETITEAPKDCDDSGAIWESGKRLFGYLKTRNIGQTGQVAFDDNGDRVYAEYDVINVHENHSFVKVGSFHYDSLSFRANLHSSHRLSALPSKQIGEELERMYPRINTGIARQLKRLGSGELKTPETAPVLLSAIVLDFFKVDITWDKVVWNITCNVQSLRLS
ncbi:glutamate [NMDA] receptor subunit 1-like, partial [Anopheles cruzii]|uniref:glutamate [NMDA] receptor subunit 1-like n=1 Tax=Anopheles cruzii TaxID=68878 RepID=UPI0022EC415C